VRSPTTASRSLGGDAAWSNGRVGIYGTLYEGQAAELVDGLGNLPISGPAPRA
jgi:hypothetical protein